MTVILTAPSLRTYVMSRAVTEQFVTQSRRLVEFTVSKWLKFMVDHLFQNKKTPEGVYAGCVGVRKNYRYVERQWKIE